MHGSAVAQLKHDATVLRQVTVGQRLTVDTVDNLSVGGSGQGEEVLHHIVGHQTLEHIGHKRFAHHGTRTLITQDVTKGRSILKNVVTIVITTVGTRTENAGNARLMTAKGTRSAQQVGMDLHLNIAQQVAQQVGHQSALVDRATGSIEVNGIGRLTP